MRCVVLRINSFRRETVCITSLRFSRTASAAERAPVSASFSAASSPIAAASASQDSNSVDIVSRAVCKSLARSFADCSFSDSDSAVRRVAANSCSAAPASARVVVISSRHFARFFSASALASWRAVPSLAACMAFFCNTSSRCRWRIRSALLSLPLALRTKPSHRHKPPLRVVSAWPGRISACSDSACAASSTTPTPANVAVNPEVPSMKFASGKLPSGGLRSDLVLSVRQ